MELLYLSHLMDKSLVKVLFKLSPQLLILCVQFNDEMFDPSTSECTELFLDILSDSKVLINSSKLYEHILHIRLSSLPNFLHVFFQESLTKAFHAYLGKVRMA